MTSFTIKIIAALTMFIDHMGLILFPQYRIFRIIGRLAFPLYAYCIAEGFRYTRNRRRYFLRVFTLGLLCQIVYTIVERDLYIGILLTFSMSIIIMVAQNEFIKALKSPGEQNIGKRICNAVYSFADGESNNGEIRRIDKLVCGAVYAMSVLAAAAVCFTVEVDYGFLGVMLPVSAALFDNKQARLLSFSVCLVLLSAVQTMSGSSTQIYCLLSLIPLYLYNGEQGKHKLKYFFYIFYPAHLGLLYLIDALV